MVQEKCIMGHSMECLSGTTLGSEVSRSTKMRHQLLFGEIDASSSSCKISYHLHLRYHGGYVTDL